MSLRRRYYNLFSQVYDGFVRLHSRDAGQSMRTFLSQVAELEPGFTVVDLCTGTGSSALRMAQQEGTRVIGIDFSEGMLCRAVGKSPPGAKVFWIQADVGQLPVSSGSVDRVTCAYAMYELSAHTRERVLDEVVRILRPGGRFVMVEHLPPERFLIRTLYLIRVRLLGRKGARSFAGAEEKELRRFFHQVGTVAAQGGRTKATFGHKAHISHRNG